MTRKLPLLALLAINLVSARVRAESAPALPSPTKGSCSQTIKKEDGTVNPAFAGPATCIDFLGAKFTEQAVAKGCGEGTTAATPCPLEHVLQSCQEESKSGLIVMRWYAATAEESEFSRDYNEKVRKRGCKAPWTPLVAAATAASAAPVAAHGEEGAAKPLGSPSHGGCTAPFPPDLKLTGAQSCFEFPGDQVSFEGIKSTCTGIGTAAPSMCPVTHVALNCTRSSGRGPVVMRWYAAPNEKSDPNAKTYNEELLKRGCKAPWSAY